MSRTTRTVFLCITAALVLFQLSVTKPGLPGSLKADEPAYFLMALSLVEDGDLLCETSDTRRLFDEFPYLRVRNLILMTDDGWDTVYFGKPYIYSLFAAPFAALAGASGMVAFNTLLLMLMIWMGTSYLSRYNSSSTAALFSTGFFLLSNTFAYVFWLHPEIFNMTAATTALYLGFHEFRRPEGSGFMARARGLLLNPRTRLFWSGAALALGVYNKPVMVALALPLAWIAWRRHGFRDVLALGMGLALSLALVVGLNVALTGHPSAYLGVARGGLTIHHAGDLPVEQLGARVEVASTTQNSWSWIFRLPELDLPRLFEDAGYFLWGRHVGLFTYAPFSLLALLLFAAHNRRSVSRWLTFAALASVAMFFFIWIPFNWHGGGGFVGNRYFVNVYPAFLFLVTRIRPAWLNVVAYAAGGAMIGPILFTPFGAPVVEPTLQAHVRNAPYRYLPIELSLAKQIPGYHGLGQGDTWFWARKDVMRIRDGRMRLQGASRVEVWVQSFQPIGTAIFEVQTMTPGNRIELLFGGTKEILEFPDPLTKDNSIRRVEIAPHKTYKILWDSEQEREKWVYKLIVDSRTGHRLVNAKETWKSVFYLGAEIAYLGTVEQHANLDFYQVEFKPSSIPETVTVGENFFVRTAVGNRGTETWYSKGPTRVNLSYHWLDEDGKVVIQDGRRTALPKDLESGQWVSVAQRIVAPKEPGRYVLHLDPVREKVSWFSKKNGGSVFAIPIEVVVPNGVD